MDVEVHLRDGRMSERMKWIDALILEVTRRCNFRCAHCLRGEAEDAVMSDAVIRAAFRGVKYIGTIIPTGGEPGLVPHVIQRIIDIAEEEDTEIGNFYIATNGSIGSDDFMRAIMNLWLFCTDNESSQVEISETDYHQFCGQDEEAIKKLEMLRFVSHRKKLEYQYVIAEGRGEFLCETNGTIDDARRVHARAWAVDEDEEGRLLDQPYVNVYGTAISECDFSYDRQEENKDGNILIDSWQEIIARNQRRAVTYTATEYPLNTFPKEEWLAGTEPTLGGQPA